MRSYVRVSTPPLHVDKVNAFIKEAEKETDNYFKSIVTRAGIPGLQEYRSLTKSSSWDRHFLAVMNRLTVAAGLRVAWPRPDANGAS